MLSADPGDETNRLLRLLVQGVDNTTLMMSDIGPPPFAPSNDAVHVNQLFTISLTCSLLAALGALFGQQWITSYKRRPDGGFEEERRERQRRVLGAKRWKMEFILQLVLPVLLQSSVIIFLVGMAIYLKSLSGPVAKPNVVISWIGAGAVAITILLALVDPQCPFKTPFSDIIHFFLRHLTPQNWHGRLRASLKHLIQRLWARPWSEDALEAHSIRRILATSADSKTLHEVSLNIPLIRETSSLNVIYADEIAMTHLYQLYETQSIQSGTDAPAYSAAICHLVLSAPPYQENRTNRLLRHHELRILLDSARAHVTRPNDPISTLPSSIITVALAYLLSEVDGRLVPTTGTFGPATYLSFIVQAIYSSPIPTFPIATLAWVLVSSRNLTPSEETRRRAKADLEFRYSPPDAVDSGSGLFRCASEAYKVFYEPSKYALVSILLRPTMLIYHFSPRPRMTRKILRSITCALESQSPPSDASRQLLSSMINALTYLYDTVNINTQAASELIPVLEALRPLLDDVDFAPSVARSMCALLHQLKPDFEDFDAFQVSPAILDALDLYAQTDPEIRSKLDDYRQALRNFPTLQGT